MKGAHQVNLDIGDRPSDVYSGVAAMANEQIQKDCLEGHPHALMLKGKVTRKVVKQTVCSLPSPYFSPRTDFVRAGDDDCVRSNVHRSETTNRETAERARRHSAGASLHVRALPRSDRTRLDRRRLQRSDSDPELAQSIRATDFEIDPARSYSSCFVTACRGNGSSIEGEEEDVAGIEQDSEGADDECYLDYSARIARCAAVPEAEEETGEFLVSPSVICADAVRIGRDCSSNGVHYRSDNSRRGRSESASYRLPAEFHSLPRRYAHDDDRDQLQGSLDRSLSFSFRN